MENPILYEVRSKVQAIKNGKKVKVTLVAFVSESSTDGILDELTNAVRLELQKHFSEGGSNE